MPKVTATQETKARRRPDRGAGAPSRRAIGATIAALACLVLAFSASPALALQIHPFLKSVEVPGQAPEPVGVAVNQSTHHVYVVNTQAHAVYNLDSNGNLDPTRPELVNPGPGFNPYNLTIDNNAGATNGYLYTAELARGVQQFDATGVATAVQIDKSDIPPNGTPQAGGLPNVVNNGDFSASAVAVDSSGNVFVVDQRNRTIDEFSPSGAFVAQLAFGTKLVSGFITGLAVGSAGELYLANSKGLFRLTPSGECADGSFIDEGEERCVAFAPTVAPGYFVGVTLTASGRVLATETFSNPPDPNPHGRIVEFDASGNLLSSSGADRLIRPTGIAVEEASGNVYVAEEAPFLQGTLQIFGPLLTLPDATTEPATAVADHSATLNGTVGADEGLSTTCVFQYADDATFKASGFEGASSAPCSPAGPFTDEAPTSVHADIAGLGSGTTYHVRLLATNENGSTPGEDVPFVTLGPTVGGESASAVSDNSATLEGTVNPNGAQTTYRFQYVSEVEFEQSGYDNASEVPVGGEDLGAGSATVDVSQPIIGLLPNTAYRFRILATSTAGTSEGTGGTFVTYPTLSGLPDGRAYEQATPVDKNGANASGLEQQLKASPDGSAISYFITGGGSGGEGGQDFPSYVASRGADGWQSHGLLPSSAVGERAKVIGWSEDLARDYVLIWNSGTPATLYRRQVSTGALEEMASGLEPPTQTWFAGESEDGSRVLLESTSVLTAGATAGISNLYLWDEASGLELLSVLPGETPATAGAFAGPYQWFFDQNTSEGGSASGYYTQDINVLSEDGSKAFFTTKGDAQLYMRSGIGTPGIETVKVSASQRTSPDPGEKPAAFLEATPDGRYVFLASSSKLTDDATTGSGDQGNDLYRYDTESGELVDLVPDPTDANGADVIGMIGASEDGTHVYFAANGALAPGAGSGNCSPEMAGGTCSLYLWQEGTVSFIARLNGGGTDGLNWLPTSYSSGGKPMRTGRVSADGEAVSFFSGRSLTSYDSEGHAELYHYNTGEGLQCVSCNPTGAPPVGSASLQDLPRLAVNPPSPNPILASNLSADGSRVFFESPDRLALADTNGEDGCEELLQVRARPCQDVYMWEANGTGSCQSSAQNGGCIHLISSGDSPEASYFAGIGESGDDAFFFTTSQLVGQDIDHLVDVYDARVGGTPQNPPPPNPCSGEACKAGASLPAVQQSPGSATFNGPANAKQKHATKKHKHKKSKKHKKKTRKHSKGRAQR